MTNIQGLLYTVWLKVYKLGRDYKFQFLLTNVSLVLVS